MQDVERVIETERLRLPLLDLGQLRRLADGDVRSVAAELRVELGEEWAEEVQGLAARRAAQLADHPGDAPWLLRAIVRADTNAAIGYLNFHAAPDARGMVEIGYTLLPAARGRGYAREAVAGAFAWATRQPGVRFLRASIAPDNARSRNLVTKLGLVEVGDQWDDEDGLELVYETEVATDGAR